MNTVQKPSFSWTVRYALLNIAYFVAFCTIHAYAAVYLLSNGFSNTEIGVLLAIANIASALLQPIIAGLIDKPGFLTNKRFIVFAVLFIIAGLVILPWIPGKKGLIFVIYALIYMMQFAYQPSMTALCFEYQRRGCNIMYGLARGLGSAGFAVTSVFIGRAVEDRGVTLLLWVDIAAMLFSLAVILTFTKPGAQSVSSGQDISEVPDPAQRGSAVAHNNIAAFASTYPAFMLFLIGTVCFFFAHNMINDFMFQIIQSMGGNETELGYAGFLQAILELPVMALIGIILKKISADRLLIISGIAFFVKILILVFAKGMPQMYISQFFQLFAYAVFIPAGAYYVSSTMEELDQVKGQAYITSAITIGGVFSNLISGAILDRAGIFAMLITGTAVCAAGALITFVAMKVLPHHKTA